jgi:hypothetical protein
MYAKCYAFEPISISISIYLCEKIFKKRKIIIKKPYNTTTLYLNRFYKKNKELIKDSFIDEFSDKIIDNINYFSHSPKITTLLFIILYIFIIIQI